MKNIFPNNQSGFTIVESLVTIFVINMALIPILSSALSSLNVSANIRDTFIAANLAQEGPEVVRAIRDRNWYIDPIPNPPYPLMDPPSGTLKGTWRVQWDSDSLINVGANPPLKIDSNGVYNYTTGTDTIFRRRIIIEEGNTLDPGKDMRIISEVTWTTRDGIIKKILAESHLFNWK